MKEISLFQVIYTLGVSILPNNISFIIRKKETKISNYDNKFLVKMKKKKKSKFYALAQTERKKKKKKKKKGRVHPERLGTRFGSTFFHQY